MATIEIYWDDLTSEKQQEIFEHLAERMETMMYFLL